MRLEMRHVVAMVMRDDDGVEAARKNVVAESSHRVDRFFRADPSVEQNANTLGFDDDSVAARPAGENENAHGPLLRLHGEFGYAALM